MTANTLQLLTNPEAPDPLLSPEPLLAGGSHVVLGKQKFADLSAVPSQPHAVNSIQLLPPLRHLTLKKLLLWDDYNGLTVTPRVVQFMFQAAASTIFAHLRLQRSGMAGKHHRAPESCYVDNRNRDYYDAGFFRQFVESHALQSLASLRSRRPPRSPIPRPLLPSLLPCLRPLRLPRFPRMAKFLPSSICPLSRRTWMASGSPANNDTIGCVQADLGINVLLAVDTFLFGPDELPADKAAAIAKEKA